MRKTSTRLIQILMRRFPARHAANNDYSLIYSFHCLYIKGSFPIAYCSSQWKQWGSTYNRFGFLFFFIQKSLPPLEK